MVILLITEDAMIEVLCGVKSIEKRSSQELKICRVWKKLWTDKSKKVECEGRYVLRRDYDNVLKRTLRFKVAKGRGCGRPKKTRRKRWKNRLD